MKPNFSLNYKGAHFSAASLTPEHTPEGDVYTFDPGVTVTIKTKEYKEYDATEWVLYFENKSDKNSGIFSNILDCDIVFPLELTPIPNPGFNCQKGDACVITMRGMIDGKYYPENNITSAEEYRIYPEYLDKCENNTKTFESIGGRSSDGMMPFFDATAKGKGYMAAIGWTGGWRATFSRCENGISMKTGLKDTNFYLKPGEKIRTTSILIMKYEDENKKFNKFRRLIKNHFSHKSTSPNSPKGILASFLWGGLTSKEMKTRINRLKEHNLFFDQIWIDAGWYGKCTKCDEGFSGDWFQHTGDWSVNTRVHPGGLKDVSQTIKDANMGLLLWFEPERAIEGTPITTEHPDWFLSREESSSKILNLGNSDALEYACNLISGYIEKLDLKCYRQDFNVNISPFWDNNDTHDRKGISEIKHIMGLYKFWDFLLEKHPHLIIDNCSSGGRRIDIESLKRSIPFFRTDYLCGFTMHPDVLQSHNSNIAQYLPYIGCANITKTDIYDFRSSYSSSIGFTCYGTIFQSIDDSEFPFIEKTLNEYRRIRKYLSMDFYNHGADCFDETAWAIWQYHDPETQSGIVMSFRRANSPFDNVTLKLSGMEESKTYIYTNLNNDEIITQTDTLKISLPEKRSSVIFEYKMK